MKAIVEIPKSIKQFISTENWVFAQSYADTWPHEYIVKTKTNSRLFIRLVQLIREYGYDDNFYDNIYTYLNIDGLIYWTMVPPQDDIGWYPVENETIINRCHPENTYQERERNGTLPIGDSPARR